MSRPTIGGQHGAELLAALSGRDRHRPSDPAAIDAEIRRLHSTGLQPRDISTALRIALPAVLTALRADSPDGSQP